MNDSESDSPDNEPAVAGRIARHEQLMPTFDVYHAEADGVTVVHVCTNGMPENIDGPVIRIYLNDEPVFENPQYPTASTK